VATLRGHRTDRVAIVLIVLIAAGLGLLATRSTMAIDVGFVRLGERSSAGRASPIGVHAFGCRFSARVTAATHAAETWLNDTPFGCRRDLRYAPRPRRDGLRSLPLHDAD
jgi:hypothetical protein